MGVAIHLPGRVGRMATPGYEVAHISLLLLGGTFLRRQPLLVLGAGGVESNTTAHALSNHILAADLRVSGEHLVSDVPNGLRRTRNVGLALDRFTLGLGHFDRLEAELTVDLDDLVLTLFEASLLSSAVGGRLNAVEFHIIAPVLVNVGGPVPPDHE